MAAFSCTVGDVVCRGLGNTFYILNVNCVHCTVYRRIIRAGEQRERKNAPFTKAKLFLTVIDGETTIFTCLDHCLVPGLRQLP